MMCSDWLPTVANEICMISYADRQAGEVCKRFVLAENAKSTLAIVRYGHLLITCGQERNLSIYSTFQVISPLL